MQVPDMSDPDEEWGTETEKEVARRARHVERSKKTKAESGVLSFLPVSMLRP
jgi:hypothetical protein